MEYLTYILVTVGIVVFCALLLRVREPVRIHELDSQILKKRTSVTPAKKTVKKNNRKALLGAEAALKRERKPVPVPWGWPGHENHVPGKTNTALNAEEVHGVSESLHRFADRLMMEKQTVDNREYLLNRDASLRALIEDRYGRNHSLNGSGRKAPKEPDIRDIDEKIKFEPLQELKTPWGW
jgi:hypothetical protein